MSVGPSTHMFDSGANVSILLVALDMYSGGPNMEISTVERRNRNVRFALLGSLDCSV